VGQCQSRAVCEIGREDPAKILRRAWTEGLDRRYWIGADGMHHRAVLTWIDFSQVARVTDAPDELPHLLAAVQGVSTSMDVVRDAICSYRGLDAGWRRDLAVSYGRVAMIEARQGAREQALSGVRSGRDILAWLKAQSPDDTQLPKDLGWFDGQILAPTASP
jgi:hypothetical protein